jgi:predicted DNA-binding transcriptional regulator AlpA
MSERTRHLVELTEADLKILIMEVLAEHSSQTLGTKIPAPIDDLIPRVEVAKLFGISLVTLAKWARLKILPKPVKLGGRVFYVREQINALIKSKVRAFV